MPACSRRRSTGGRVRRFGAGRVISQTEMAALRLPRASSASGGAPIGSIESRFESGLPVGQRRGAARLQDAIAEVLRQVDGKAGFPESEIDAASTAIVLRGVARSAREVAEYRLWLPRP